MILKVKFKKLVEHAFTPTYATDGSACLDLYAADQGYYDQENKFVEFGTGIAVEIPKGYVGLLYPRSSISNTPHFLANSVGVLDSDYTEEIKLRFRTHFENPDLEYSFGNRIGQIMIVPIIKVEFEEVEELSNSDREGGFGSTGT